jgi:RNA polymerase sigma-70 factor, ECF subfamily
VPARQPTGVLPAQAAINAVYADAPTFQDTDWSQIVALYDHLCAIALTPVVALNRAIAIGELRGAAAALALVDELDLETYSPFHATRADLLTRLGRDTAAATAYERAAALAPTDAERDFLSAPIRMSPRLGGARGRSGCSRS